MILHGLTTTMMMTTGTMMMATARCRLLQAVGG